MEQIIFNYQTFNEWYDACATLPHYRDIRNNYSYKPEKLDAQEIKRVLRAFKLSLMNSSFVDKEHWIDQKAPDEASLDFNGGKFTPYAQKLVVTLGSEIAFHGDLHGDIHSICEYIKDLSTKGYLDPKDPFKIMKDNFYMVFLGDYTDRGNYGIEVLYTILRLKIANPDKVFMVRGNHEDSMLNQRYGFADELYKKFPNHTDLPTTIYGLYNLLPVVLYFGSGEPTSLNFLQCCHGGIELGYLPKNLFEHQKNVAFEWLSSLDRGNNLKTLLINKFGTSPAANALINEHMNKVSDACNRQTQTIKHYGPQDLGFIWNDFIAPKGYYLENSARGVGIVEHGDQLTEIILKGTVFNNHRLQGILRAHQHNEDFMMSVILDKNHPDSLGIGKLWHDPKLHHHTLWENIVCTFNVGPDTGYGIATENYPGFSFDTYGIITTGKQYPHDWVLKAYHNEIIKKNKNKAAEQKDSRL